MVFGFFVMCNDEDIKYMRMALALAERGREHVGPNPMVGAVIVRDGRVLARGWHHVCGSLHAERDALASCSESVEGATMYVTLEPCCHHGKQPPCTDAIIAAGISRVVMAMTDPNPLVAGHGAAILQEYGIEVTSGVLEAEARHLNRIFIKYITTRRPWVVRHDSRRAHSRCLRGLQVGERGAVPPPGARAPGPVYGYRGRQRHGPGRRPYAQLPSGRDASAGADHRGLEGFHASSWPGLRGNTGL